MAEEICHRRWRDTYQREKKRESSEKRSERAAQSTNKWTYSAVLSFLDPCITPRETSGNMGRRGGGPWKRREQRQQQGVSKGSGQVKTQHQSLVKEKIHMAEEAGAISHAPARRDCCIRRAENFFAASVVNTA
ncbi:hypothetical protein EYF80_050221 [Liparis tanakae]|uniref:Uncharacterized protein n=1 Tax=Liparis tanakae TaxID=230148 RepID=A0A4Z2FGX9_9TELE|nr:hypothetical protein EYF80_050221 [Liparis tanakae]